MTRRTPQDGYVLLMTLLLIGIVGAAMAGACRQGLARALQARRAAEDLQRRWGALSCQRTFLPMASNLLEEAAQSSREPVAAVALPLRLGGQDVWLIAADEQAKANVNVLYERRGRQAMEQVVSALTAGLADRLEVLVRPATPWASGQRKAGGADEPTPPALGCFGQVFADTVGPEQLAGRTPSFRGAAGVLTCWGDGRLNFRRADPETLLQVCRPDLGAADVEALVRMRTQTPGIGLGRAMADLKLSQDKQDRAMRLLTDQSRAHSLWIITATGGRVWHRLAVQASAAEAAGSGWGGGNPLFEW